MKVAKATSLTTNGVITVGTAVIGAMYVNLTFPIPENVNLIASLGLP